MAYEGIDCATALINISLPAFDSHFSFHPGIRFQTLSFKYANTLVLDLPIYTGSPKYLNSASPV
jgi:hypothetical protein